MSHYGVLIIVDKDEKDPSTYLNRVLEPFDESKKVPHVAMTSPALNEEFEAYKADHPEDTEYMNVVEYAQGYHGYRVDADGNAISTYNPDSKWDWWMVGGRWSNMLREKGTGAHRDVLDVGNIDFDAMQRENIENAEKRWKNAEGKTGIERYLSGIDSNDTFESHMASWNHSLALYACITKDGKWCARGEMGLFGMSSDDESALEWNQKFYDRFIKDLDPEDVLVVVDCHI